jgi:hypothetical protein
MQKRFIPKICNDNRGFSLLEVLLGVSVFMIGMLGVTALNISSLKSNTFSGNLSEASVIAADKLEEILAMDYGDDDLVDTDGDGTGQDENKDGIDDDAVTIDTHDDDTNFGLDDIEGEADYPEEGIGRNAMYDLYWNVAEDEPVPNTKTVNVIVRWQIKDVWRQINMSTIRVREL